MNQDKITRRRFLKRSASAALGTLTATTFARSAHGASKERVVIYQGVSLDSLHPYGYSGGGINGTWLPLI